MGKLFRICRKFHLRAGRVYLRESKDDKVTSRTATLDGITDYPAKSGLATRARLLSPGRLVTLSPCHLSKGEAMKRAAAMFVVLAGLGGCMSPDAGPGSMVGHNGMGSPTVPGVQGPWGQPVPMIAPYSANPPGAVLARQMMSTSMPLGMVQPSGPSSGMMAHGGPSPSGVVQASYEAPGAPGNVVQVGGLNPPGMSGLPTMAPPGVPGGSGSGVMQAGYMQGGCYNGIPNVVAARGAITGPGGPRFPTQRTEVKFVGPSGMRVSWPGPYGEVRNNYIEAPGRYNFIQGAIYRLKLSDLPGRPGIDLYPTLEVVPANLRTDAYIAHSSVPLYFSDEDIEQVLGGNFLVKVIYLPNPQYADVAMTGGPEEVSSTRLEPGVDPIAEACKRGSILLIIRMGNIDLEAPNTPPMNAPNPYGMGGRCAMGPAGPGVPMTMPGSGPPMIAVGPLDSNAPMTAGDAKTGIVPVSKPAGQPTGGPAGQPTSGMSPLSRSLDALGILPVRHQEPSTAPTPAAGQSK
jgi:hypothetical protein